MTTDYYSFYGLPIHLNIDESVLKKKFFELSRLYHPDLFANATPAEQDKALQISTLNTLAYKVLSDRNSRLEHVFDLHQIERSETLPQDFLMEMMDLNEEVEEATAATQPELARQILEMRGGFDAEMGLLFGEFDRAETSKKTSILLRLNQLHLKNKYLLRLQQSLNIFAA